MMDKQQPIVVEIRDQRFEIPSPEYLDISTDNEFHFFYNHHTYHIQVLDFDLISGICTIKIEGQVREAKILRDIDIRIEQMGLNQSHAGKQDLVFAPMPGLVISIIAQVGQSVSKGDPLLILEAMKMENVISAPHDALIKTIRVSTGQAVEKSFPLIELE